MLRIVSFGKGLFTILVRENLLSFAPLLSYSVAGHRLILHQMITKVHGRFDFDFQGINNCFICLHTAYKSHMPLELKLGIHTCTCMNFSEYMYIYNNDLLIFMYIHL